MPNVLTGSEVLRQREFRDLRGLRIGFVGNHTSRLADGAPTHAALHAAPDVTLASLFSPEHGAFGREDREDIGHDQDPVTGLPILSLYGDTRKPTPEMLQGLDALVFEIQDVGARFYTYASTMLLCLEAAHEAGIQMFVLDRPNPISGRHVEGPLPDENRLSFVVSHTIPVRHGLTLGELARLAGSERGTDSRLSVIACEGHRRDYWWSETGLAWVHPSPAMRSLDAAAVYPGVCLLEQTNVSVGRGTDMPFLITGAPWIDAKAWATAVNANSDLGLVAEAYEFTPTLRTHEGQRCQGLRLTILSRESLNSVRLGLILITALRDQHSEHFEMDNIIKLLANSAVQKMLMDGADASEIEASWAAQMKEWETRAAEFRLYD